ncbi:MAG: hypothetical protein HC831_15940 [Chloroflexia bacterium]|nr:hypothetical protein [Chloroflexia bacterium]
MIFIEDVNAGEPLSTGAATIGTAFRPIYEILLKTEYKRIFAKKAGESGTGFEDYQYNYFQFSCVISF